MLLFVILGAIALALFSALGFAAYKTAWAVRDSHSFDRNDSHNYNEDLKEYTSNLTFRKKIMSGSADECDVSSSLY